MFARKNAKYYFRLYIHEESGREGLGENWLQAIQQKCKLIQEQRCVDIDEPAVMVSLTPPNGKNVIFIFRLVTSS